MSLLETTPQSEPAVTAAAALALTEIAAGNEANQKLVVQSEGVAQLANLMKSSSHASVRAEVSVARGGAIT